MGDGSLTMWLPRLPSRESASTIAPTSCSCAPNADAPNESSSIDLSNTTLNCCALPAIALSHRHRERERNIHSFTLVF